NFPIDDAVDRYSPNGHLAVGRRNAEKFRSMGAGPNESADHFVPFLNLLLDRPMHVRKRCTEATQDILETAESRSLTGKWSQLDDVFVKIFSGSLNLAVIEPIVDKVADQLGVIFHLEGNAPRLPLVRCPVNELLAIF